MAIYLLGVTNGRILEATAESPIAIFRTPNRWASGSQYNSVFAATVESQRVISEKPANLMGVYFGEDGVLGFKVDRGKLRRNALDDGK